MQNSVDLFLEKEIKDSFSVACWSNRSFPKGQLSRLIYHSIVLISHGKGNLTIDDKSFDAADDQLFLISKGQILSIHEGSTLSGYIISFGDCFWERAPQSANNCKALLFTNASANQCLTLSSLHTEELQLYIKMLFEEFSKPNYVNKIEVMAAYLKIIMIKIANINIGQNSGIDTHENQLYRHFLEFLSEHYREYHEVADYARLLSISSRKLTDLSKRCAGKGAKDTINGYLIEEAKRSLQFSSLPVKEVAYQLNFASPAQFSHFFKKHTSFSPGDYRSNFVKIGR